MKFTIDTEAKTVEPIYNTPPKDLIAFFEKHGIPWQEYTMVQRANYIYSPSIQSPVDSGSPNWWQQQPFVTLSGQDVLDRLKDIDMQEYKRQILGSFSHDKPTDDK